MTRTTTEWLNTLDAGRVVRASFDLITNVITNVERLVADVRRDSRTVADESEALYAAAGERATAIQEAIRATPRFARIISEGVKVIASYRGHRAKRAFLTPEGAAGELEGLHRANAERMRMLCLELRGGLLKLGQFVSCRMDLLPPAYVEELSTLQDRVPPVDTAAIIERIESELGRPVDQLFASFDPEPIAAASLAQVHAATLADGTRVAVKVQLPGIEEIIDIDLAALRVLSSLLGEMVPRFDIATITSELSRSVRRELDFVAEAENIADFAGHFAGDPNIVVPGVRPELSSKRVLTMELIEGSRLIEFLDGCRERGEAGERDRDRVFEIMIGCFCAQILGEGLFHSDPHPGNFLICDGPANELRTGPATELGTAPRLAVLDFGSVERFTPEVRRAYAELAGAILGRNHHKIAELLGVMGFRTSSGDSDSLLEFSEMMLELFREEAGAIFRKIDPQAELQRALEIARKNPIVQVPRDFVMLGRVFGALSGLLFHYQPRINLFALIAPHLSRALARAA